MRITLPYPPTVNSTWKRNRNGSLRVDARTLQFRIDVMAEALSRFGQDRKTKGRLAVRIDLMMPDKRRRDLDNICKGLLDAMQHAGLYDDDSQIDYLAVKRLGIESPGRAYVCIEEIVE